MALNKQKTAGAFLFQKPGVAGNRNECITCAPSAPASNPRRWLLLHTLEICLLPVKLRKYQNNFPLLINKCLSPRATRRHWLAPFPTVQKACSLPSAPPLMQNHQQNQPVTFTALAVSYWLPSNGGSIPGGSRCLLRLHHMRVRHLSDVQPTQHFCFFKACRTLSAAALFLGLLFFLVIVQLVVCGAKQTSVRD